MKALVNKTRSDIVARPKTLTPDQREARSI